MQFYADKILHIPKLLNVSFPLPSMDPLLKFVVKTLQNVSSYVAIKCIEYLIKRKMFTLLSTDSNSTILV